MSAIEEISQELERQPKTVDWYLNNVDYSALDGYVPSQFALDVVNLIKLIEGGETENKTPPVHYQFLDTLVKEGDATNLCHRGYAKTTLLEYVFWYIALFNKLPKLGSVPYALYVSDSVDNGVKKMRRSMESRRMNSKFLQEYLPEDKVRFTDNIWDIGNADGGRFVITGHGAQSGVRGTRENNSRPILAVLDDLLSDTDAKSPTVIARVEDTVYKAVGAALRPDKRKIIWNGTPFNAGDPLYKAVESGAYNVNVFPVAEKFPCKREEFRGSWDDRFTYDALVNIKKVLDMTGHSDAFNQEYMLRIMDEEDRIITNNDVQWYSRARLMNKRNSFNYYITTDFATSEKKSSDYSVISVWALSNNGDWFWVDGMLEKQLMDKNVDKLFSLVQAYNPLSVGIEVSGQQGGFIPWLKNEMLDRNIFFNLASENNSNNEGIRPKTNKFARFMQVVPLFKAKKMYFPEELKESPVLVELMEELRLTTHKGFKSKHDDAIDTVSMLMDLKTFRPSGELVNTTSGMVSEDVYSMFEDEVYEPSVFDSYTV